MKKTKKTKSIHQMGGEATFKKYGSTHFSKLKSDYWKKRKAEENKVTKVGKK